MTVRKIAILFYHTLRYGMNKDTGADPTRTKIAVA